MASDGPAGGRRPGEPAVAEAGGADGEDFGPYRLLDLLGRGGMGEVWRAFDRRRERTVALKRLAGGWADVPEFRERFRREARATARLDSAHVITIHDFGEIDGQLFLDMRLIRGGDLASVLARRPGGVEVARAVDLIGQIASGLDAAHRDGLVHRDVKPSNVLIEPDDTRELAYLVDFGIAKVADETTGKDLTASGATLGTPAYMAPELFTDANHATVGSDVYALGCVLFEMLTGRRPFTATGAFGLMNQHLHLPPPRPSEVRPDLAPFDPVLVRALDKDPDRRQLGAGALAADAAAVARRLSGAPVAPVAPVTPAPPAREPAGARPWWRRPVALVAVAVLVAAGVGVGVVASRWPGSAPAPTDAGPAPAPVPTAAPAPALTGPTPVPIALHAPEGVAFSPDGRRAYVANTGTQTIAVTDTATSALLATIRVPGGAEGIAVSADGRRAYVADSGSPQQPASTMSTVDLTSDTVVGQVAVGLGAYAVALSPDDRRAYVTAFGTDADPGSTVAVVDTATNTVTATVPVGLSPTQPLVSPDGRRVYVPFFGPAVPHAAGVTVLDALGGPSTTLPAGDEEPVGAVLAPDGRRLYVATLGPGGAGGGVQVVDTATGATTAVAGVPAGVEGLAATPDRGTLVAAVGGGLRHPAHAVTVIDTATDAVRRTVTLPGRPNGVSITPDGREAWVTTDLQDGLWRIPLP